MGHPIVHDRAEMLAALNEYIENTAIPIVAEFATIQKVSRTYLYDTPELADALKRCVVKKEAALEKLALEGKVNCSMAIFSLKQLGWSDKQETTLKGDKTQPLVISSSDGKL